MPKNDSANSAPRPAEARLSAALPVETENPRRNFSFAAKSQAGIACSFSRKAGAQTSNRHGGVKRISPFLNPHCASRRKPPRSLAASERISYGNSYRKACRAEMRGELLDTCLSGMAGKCNRRRQKCAPEGGNQGGGRSLRRCRSRGRATFSRLHGRHGDWITNLARLDLQREFVPSAALVIAAQGLGALKRKRIGNLRCASKAQLPLEC